MSIPHAILSGKAFSSKHSFGDKIEATVVFSRDLSTIALYAVQVFPKAYLALSVLSAIRASSAPLRILSAAKALTQQFVCSWIAGSATFRLTVCNLFLERCKPASGGPRPAKSQVAHIRHQPHDPEFQVCFAPAYSFNGIGSGRGLAYDFRTFTDHSCC